MLYQRRELPPEADLFYLNHPVEFTQEMVYGIRREDGKYLTLTPEDVEKNIKWKRLEWQTKDILNAIAEHDYVSVHSGKGISKTTSLSMAGLWFMYTRENAKVIVTGPKFDQLKATIWAEILKWLTRSEIKDQIKWTAEKMYHVAAPGLWFGQILTSKQKENISGIHEDHVLWLCDEAENIENDIIDTILAGMTGIENKIVLTGNPTKVTGRIYESFTLKKDKPWHVLHFSSEDSDICNKEWLAEMQAYPRESDMYRVYVLGLPPTGNPRCIITLADCEDARMRWIRLPDKNEEHMNYLEMGVEPAGEGDDLTAIAVRCGMQLLEVATFAKTKAPEVYHHILMTLRKWRKAKNIYNKVKIKIDAGYGQQIADFLALNVEDNIEVIPIHFGGGGTNRYADNVTSMWFNMADIIEEVSLPEDDLLIRELCGREWIPSSGHKQKTESKSEYKKRLGRSPDRADATILCYYTGKKKIFSRKEDSESYVKYFNVDWDLQHVFDPAFEGILLANVWHIVTVVLNQDISINGIAMFYEYYRNKLWVYDEFYQETPIAEQFVPKLKEVTRKGFYKDYRDAKIFGNHRIFEKRENSRPYADILRRERLNIREPSHYEEFGAIGLGVQLFNANKVVVHLNCQRARKQFSMWSIKDGKPDKDGFGYCEALLLGLSEVKRQMKSIKPIPKMRDYQPVFTRKKEEKKKMTAWMRR